MSDEAGPTEGQIPYERWTDEALYEVVARALDLAASQGLPGEHHYYLTFRTDHPGTKVPGHLKARYPQEMTIVLQHQFEALTVNRGARFFSVRLHFGGVPSTLVIPFGALTGFADPAVRFGLRFQPVMTDMPSAEPAPALAPPSPPALTDDKPAAAPADAPAQIVSLDAFRRRPGRE